MEPEDSPKVAIVVADNQETVLQSITTTLEKAGFTVLATSSSAEALRYCRDRSQPVDLAIIDSAAAGINAPELAEQLDAITPGIRKMFLTGEEGEGTLWEVRCFSHTCRFLRKPFRRAQFLGQVLEMTDRPMVLSA
jgi:CheY-like chemotaxis protein